MIKQKIKNNFPYLFTFLKKTKKKIMHLRTYIPGYTTIHNYRNIKRRFFPSRKRLGFCGENVILEYPLHFEVPSSVYLERSTRIREFCHIINTPNEKVTVKKYTVIAANCTIITNNHRSTATIPQILLGASHINDTSTDITIGEDVWVGANATIMAGANIGRGSLIAAGALVNKPVPPYSVVAGIPAKIIARKFDLEDIITHEKALYPEEERMTRLELEELFEKHLKDKKTFGTTEGIDAQAIETLKALREDREIEGPYNNE